MEGGTIGGRRALVSARCTMMGGHAAGLGGAWPAGQRAIPALMACRGQMQAAGARCRADGAILLWPWQPSLVTPSPLPSPPPAGAAGGLPRSARCQRCGGRRFLLSRI